MKHILLVGNAPYTNRGCEAIVRGTMEILRRTFGEDIKVTNASYGPKEVIERQAKAERDPDISNVHLDGSVPRFSKRWMIERMNQRLGASIGISYPELDSVLDSASVALEIGGDNYSLDYGEPWQFFELDWHLMQRGLPVAIWGASVGPFSSSPRFEARAAKHLQNLSGVFVRETETQKYLGSIGVHKNVFLTCDPSFAMNPKMPSLETLGFEIPEGAIGLNVSPLMAKYVTNGSQSAWLEVCIETVSSILHATNKEILLIPHVSSSDEKGSDFMLLQKIAAQVPQVSVVPDTLDAEETKGLISKCDVFCGARTHSTLAAISTCVPTLSLAYSIKARGLNQDVFDSQSYCIDPKALTPQLVTMKISEMLSTRDQIVDRLRERVPKLKQLAFESGEILKIVIASHNA